MILVNHHFLKIYKILNHFDGRMILMGLVGSYSHYKCLIVHNVGFGIYDDVSDVFLLLSVVKCLVAPVAGQLFAHNGPDEGSLQDENVVSIPELEELATH